MAIYNQTSGQRIQSLMKIYKCEVVKGGGEVIVVEVYTSACKNLASLYWILCVRWATYKVKMKNHHFKIPKDGRGNRGSAKIKFISLPNLFYFLQALLYFFQNYWFTDEKFADIREI